MITGVILIVVALGFGYYLLSKVQNSNTSSPKGSSQIVTPAVQPAIVDCGGDNTDGTKDHSGLICFASYAKTCNPARVHVTSTDQELSSKELNIKTGVSYEIVGAKNLRCEVLRETQAATFSIIGSPSAELRQELNSQGVKIIGDLLGKKETCYFTNYNNLVSVFTNWAAGNTTIGFEKAECARAN